MPENKTLKTSKRPYMARDDRRRLLLDSAAEIVESSGWDKLSMSALAQHTNTSRQLVYQHFDSLEDLMVETGTHIFEQVYLQTRETIAEIDQDIVAALERAQKLTLDLPPGRAHALWQIIAATFPAEHELTRFGQRMRHLITNLWKPTIQKTFAMNDRDASATTWMLIMAFWGGYRLVEDGELSKQQAVDRLGWIITGLVDGASK